mmetsp:Transcript_31092/g.74172  ORF Transcript_31092/g.74172 Transcript_31092/m.74172 type:complete len:229 (-) Transcript_31092:1534-2220(-)
MCRAKSINGQPGPYALEDFNLAISSSRFLISSSRFRSSLSKALMSSSLFMPKSLLWLLSRMLSAGLAGSSNGLKASHVPTEGSCLNGRRLAGAVAVSAVSFVPVDADDVDSLPCSFSGLGASQVPTDGILANFCGASGDAAAAAWAAGARLLGLGASHVPTEGNFANFVAGAAAGVGAGAVFIASAVSVGLAGLAPASGAFGCGFGTAGNLEYSFCRESGWRVRKCWA